MNFSTVNECRSCGTSGLVGVLDLGNQPLANAYRRPDDESEEFRFPLALVRCRACSLVQLSGTIPPNVMFDTYLYFSSNSRSMVSSMKVLAERVTADRSLDSDDLVVEIASNDGYLLKHYMNLGIPVLGIEPATNVAEAAEQQGVPTLAEYFSPDLADELANKGQRASIIHANNVMAHVPNTNEFMAGISTLLRDNGVAIIETPYLARIIRDREFDTIYHEHVFYFSLTAISSLAERHDLVVADVEQISMHGGSLRLFIQHSGAPVSSRVGELQKAEDNIGVRTDEYYADFAERVNELKIDLITKVRQLRAEGSSMAGYGAAAKGTVLLNHCGLDNADIDYVVDRSVHKQGLLMPGVGIPILAADELAVRQPDYTLLLAWNFADEIVEQQNAYSKAGGRFIVPIPQVTFR